MIFKTLEEVPSKIWEKATLVQISYLTDGGYESTVESGRTIHFSRKPKDNYRQWYKTTEIVRAPTLTEETVPVSESEMMKILKQKYDYFNRKYKYFVITISDSRYLNTLCWVTPRPHRELCDTGISVINLDDDDAFEKMEKALGGLNGRRTKVTPKTRRAPVKKRKFVCPEKMF